MKRVMNRLKFVLLCAQESDRSEFPPPLPSRPDCGYWREKSMSLAMQRELYKEEPSDDQLWQAVLTRDAKFEGSFVYGVSSTQIYCRPTCASRRPRRDRVSFFVTTDSAEQAGFRPCKRCHPRDAEDKRSDLIQRACDLLDSAEESITLSQLSEKLGVSSFHL